MILGWKRNFFCNPIVKQDEGESLLVIHSHTRARAELVNWRGRGIVLSDSLIIYVDHLKKLSVRQMLNLSPLSVSWHRSLTLRRTISVKAAKSAPIQLNFTLSSPPLPTESRNERLVNEWIDACEEENVFWGMRMLSIELVRVTNYEGKISVGLDASIAM